MGGDYEYRWKVFPMNKVIWPFEEYRWQTFMERRKRKGKSVVLWKEQGIGDQIIFLSLAPEVQEMCSSLSVYMDPRLHSFM